MLKPILIVTLVIIINCLNNVFGDETELIPAFERSSVLYGISAQANFQVKNNSSVNLCHRELKQFYDAANQKFVWAFKMIDVSGRPGQGFLAGNNGWTGQSTVCADLTNQEPPEVYRAKIVQLITDYDFPPFQMGFITAFLRHDNELQLKTNTPLQNLIQLGLCVPQSCTGKVIKPLLEKYFEKGVLSFQKIYGTNFTIENMKTVSQNSDWLMTSSGNMIILAVIIGIMIAIAGITYYDLNIYQTQQKKDTTKKIFDQDEKSTKALETIEEENEDPVEEIKKIDNIYDKILLCFSWSKTHKLLLTSEVPDSIGAVNGMMFFGMIFMAIYNYLLYSAQYLKHLPMEFRKYESFLGQIVANSSFSIDTYLFLSGCLVSYKFYEFKHKDLTEKGIFSKISEFFIMLLERIFKTLPVYVMWILWTVYVFSYLDARWPIPIPEKAHETCAKTWWRNILHINNFYPLSNEDTCMSWTWLIAADLQYFMVNTFLLILSTKYLKLSIGIIGAIITFSIYSTGVAAYNIGYIHTLDQQLLENDAIYRLPWQRIGPYGVGMLTGLLLYKLNGKLPLQKKLIWIFWAIVPMINFYLIFGLTGIRPSVVHSTVFIAVGRTAWAVGLAWVLVACSTGNAGYLNAILSYAGFKIFHRLAYSSYILMVLNIIFLCVTFETTIFFSTISYISQIFSVALFPYLLNCIFTLHYEIPFELMWKTFIRQ